MQSKYCLLKPLVDKFKKALASGEIHPEKLAAMSSEERHALLAKVIGEKDATNINSLFERKLLQKNKANAYINWIKQIVGLKPSVRRDMISQVERMVKSKVNLLDPKNEEQFLKDLVSTKLGAEVTQEEAKHINDLSVILDKATEKWKSTGDGRALGAAKVALQQYMKDAKLNGTSSFPGLEPLEWVKYVAGNAKAITASMDNSFGGRQGFKAIANHPLIWGKNFIKSFKHLSDGFINGTQDTLNAIEARIQGRDNAINGLYDGLGSGRKLDLGGVEEAFPESIGEKIPIFKRLFNASEAAYKGMGMELRADIADAIYNNAKKSGVDMSNGVEVGNINRIVNTMTGRGGAFFDELGSRQGGSGFVNAMLWSPKFLKSNIDFLTAGQLHKEMTSFSRKLAAKNTLRTISSIAGVLALAEILWPGSTEKDPRSTDFGKVKIGNTRIDVTGGMGSLIVLASRTIPTRHNGEWGLWKKTSTGTFENLQSGKFGKQTGLDILEAFGEGKLAPFAGMVRDYLRGTDMQGNNFTPLQALYNTFTPLPIQNGMEVYKDPNAAPFLAVMIMDSLGFSASDYSPNTNWNNSTSVEMTDFKKEVGQERFDKANKEYNNLSSEKMAKLLEDPEYKALSDKEKVKEVTRMKKDVKESIFDKYDFVP